MIRTTLLMAGAATVTSLAAPRPTAQASYAPVSVLSEGAQVVRDADGLFRVHGSRGSARVAFVVDTGATATVLSARDAVRLGVAGEGAVARMTTAGGQARMRWGRLDGLVVAGRALPVLEVVVADAGLSHSLLGQDAIASLGRLTIERDRMEIGVGR